jgi:uncharacterized membrane protein YedE/YeeE
MIEPNTLGGLIGGALIGLAAVLLLALNGRIAGTFKRGVDRPLVIGAAIFGGGGGLAGFCPGPALAALASGSPRVILFVAAMLVEQWLESRLEAP